MTPQLKDLKSASLRKHEETCRLLVKSGKMTVESYAREVSGLRHGPMPAWLIRDAQEKLAAE